MSFLKIIIAILFLLVLAGIGYVAFMPTNIAQKDVTQTISISELPQ